MRDVPFAGRSASEWVRDMLGGRTDAIGQFTVTPSAASTTVTAYGCGSTSVVLLMPLDSTTATEYGLGTTYVTPAKNQFVVTHPNNANVRKYRWVTFYGIKP